VERRLRADLPDTVNCRADKLPVATGRAPDTRSLRAGPRPGVTCQLRQWPIGYRSKACARAIPNIVLRRRLHRQPQFGLRGSGRRAPRARDSHDPRRSTQPLKSDRDVRQWCSTDRKSPPWANSEAKRNHDGIETDQSHADHSKTSVTSACPNFDTRGFIKLVIGGR